MRGNFVLIKEEKICINIIIKRLKFNNIALNPLVINLKSDAKLFIKSKEILKRYSGKRKF